MVKWRESEPNQRKVLHLESTWNETDLKRVESVLRRAGAVFPDHTIVLTLPRKRVRE